MKVVVGLSLSMLYLCDLFFIFIFISIMINRISQELNYKQYKTLFESLKIKPKKNYYSELVNSY